MMTVACITALCAEVDAPLGALPSPPERPTSGPARSSPWGSCRPAQAWAPGPALAGCRATRARCVPPSPSAPGSCAAAGRLRTGRRASWPPRRGSASSPRRGSRCATPGAPAAVPTRWAGKASRTTAGWAGGNCVSSCISGGWSWGGRGPPRLARRTPCQGCGSRGMGGGSSCATPAARPRRGLPGTCHGVRAGHGRPAGSSRRCSRCCRWSPAPEARVLSPPRLSTGRARFPASRARRSKAV